ncbi:MAG: IS3 family transposase [Nevskia sp.]|nr:IS3 family transposase [Nevskia sp.]
MKYAFIQQQTIASVARWCRLLRVSRSGYYDWRGRGESARAAADRGLVAHLQRVHTQFRQAYGTRRVWRHLSAEGIACGRQRIARLRRMHGILTRRRRRFRLTTHSKHRHWIAPNLLKRQFKADKPNQAWVGDVTFVATRAGWLYLAVLLDLHSRRVVGWSMSERNDVALVLGALRMAITARRPPAGLIHHTDRGRLYAADAYRDVMARHRMVPSMSRKRDCWDNAVAESFFATIKHELIWGRDFKTRDQARQAIFEYIEVFYNRQRSHQTLDYRSPVDFEALMNVA